MLPIADQDAETVEQFRSIFASSGVHFVEYYLQLAQQMANRLEPTSRRQLVQRFQDTPLEQGERTLEQEGLATLEDERQNLMRSIIMAHSAQRWEQVIALEESLASFFCTSVPIGRTGRRWRN